MKIPTQDPRFNNFDCIRMMLALMVVFAHLYALTQIKSIAWFFTVFNSDFAVKGFFSMSGYLVMRSYIKSKNNTDFFQKRFLRIYPAYFTVIMFCVLIGILCTNDLRVFFTSSQTLKYILANLSFLNLLQPTLPGVFESNLMHSLNGALWTIKVEIGLYFLVPFFYLLYKRYNDYCVTLFLIAFSLGWFYFFQKIYTGSHGIEISRQAPGQLSYFIIGAFLSINPRVSHRLYLYVLAFAFVYFFCINEALKFIVQPFFYSTLTIFLCTQAFKNLHFGRYGDLAFGIYLYHFPIIQTLIWANLFNENLSLAILLTLILTLTLAFISWHFVEKRFLKKSSHYLKASEDSDRIQAEMEKMPG